MFSFLKKKPKNNIDIIGAPVKGEAVESAAVNDPTFAEEMLGKGIAIKPGKPTIAGKAEGKPVIGLPGHPAAAMTVFRVLMSTLLKQWGLELPEVLVPARLTTNLPSSPGRTTFQMVQLKQDGNGFLAVPIFGKSGMIHLLGHSEGYIVLEAHQEGLEQNQSVLVHML